MITIFAYFRKKLKNYMAEVFKNMFVHATNQGYRTNVLKPIMWITFILFFLTLVCLYLQKDNFAYIFVGLGTLFLIGCCYAYFYCLFKNPDLLRSEKFNLEKTALEKINITGDSFTGKVNIPQGDYVLLDSRDSEDGGN